MGVVGCNKTGQRAQTIGVLLLCLLFFARTSASACNSDMVRLQVLGSGGPELNDGRASSGYLVWHQRHARILVDAGPGVAYQFDRAGADLAELDAILFTHLHVDHSADLPALVKASYFTARETDLPVYGPAANPLMPSTTDYVQRLFSRRGVFPYLYDYVETDVPADFKLRPFDIDHTGTELITRKLSSGAVITAIGVDHGPVAALAWRVELAGCSLVFSGDTTNANGHLTKLAAGADILVAHLAISEQAGPGARNLHMPPSMIANVAATTQPKTLLLSHLMNRSMEQLAASRQIINRKYHGQVLVAEDGMVISPSSKRQK